MDIWTYGEVARFTEQLNNYIGAIISIGFLVCITIGVCVIPVVAVYQLAKWFKKKKSRYSLV